MADTKPANTPIPCQNRLRGKQATNAIQSTTKKKICDCGAAQEEFNNIAFKCAMFDMLSEEHFETVKKIIDEIVD
jgi:thioesterase domain-containing protein